uniref:heavy metal translocating P-type ATPase n=1 Tax=Thaumasiovibrio occultus TaxID=1891184 RepID=UPI000B34CE94|nr:heavy metal translocating P-type ATPase [Thaumasiovibrio occultus]
MAAGCYHCGESIPADIDLVVTIFEQEQPMCCLGCQAVAQTIVDSGLTSYYEFRTEKAAKTDLVPQQLASLKHYDLDEIQQDFVVELDNNKEVTLSLDAVSCAACAWLIEQKIGRISGVVKIHVNTTTHRALLSWDDSQVSLSELLAALHQLGYPAAPFAFDAQEQTYHQMMKQYLYRIGIAGLATMQVMMIAVALYFEVFSDLDEDFKTYFRWVSLLFATPVLLYSAMPFYTNAKRNLKARTLGMDVPVSIALLLAYFASLFATVKGNGEVFFESIAMFTFFLLVGRYLEMRARHVAATASTNLLKLVPMMARLHSDEEVAAKKLNPGDVIKILPGETVPADSVITEGSSEIDESLLTGESVPIHKTKGDQVYAGTMNVNGNLICQVESAQKASLVNNIIKLQDAAQANKPKMAEFADAVARHFVIVILIIAAATWVYWHFHQPDDAFWIMLAVLVATCPCALSLATPAALTCGTSLLSHKGLLLRKGHVIESLGKVNHLLLDKTGTLTEGNVKLNQTYCLANFSEREILDLAAGLERHANHPIAKAFVATSDQPVDFSEVSNQIGAGLKGAYQGAIYKIGTYAYCTDGGAADRDDIQVWLSRDHQVIAGFCLTDPIRKQSASFIQTMQAQGIQVTMLTGDQSCVADQVASQLNIENVHSGLSPSDKLDFLSHLDSQQVTMMIGDGVNDAPVLAQAHLSVAMGGGSDLAKTSADLVLLGDDLGKLIEGKEIAGRTYRIIKQNLCWALGYNVVILPLAVSGLVAPYIAVLGMSLSSLIVVGNSLRLTR